MRFATRLLAVLVLLGMPFAPTFAETGSGDAKAGEKKEAEPKRPFVIAVMGDSLADGVWGSLYRGYIKARREISVRRHAVNSAGFTAYNFENELEKVTRDRVDLLIFMVGANDRQRTFAVGNPREWAQFRTDKWHNLYRQNIQRFLGLVQAKKIPLVWIGLPIMRKADASEDAKLMNGIYRELAAIHGATFVDIWAATANKDGEYDAFIEDEKGRKRRFRADDGVHFTELGYDHIARVVMKAAREKLPQFQVLWSVPGP